MGTLKQTLKTIIGYDTFLKLAIINKKIKPKQKTDKSVAFLFGVSPWKYSYIKTFLSEYNVRFIEDKENYHVIINEVEKYQNRVFIAWGYKDRPRIIRYAQRRKIPYYRIEDGFIRSVQLGAAKSTPISLCMDSKGLYYDATQPSDLEDLLNNYDFNADKVLMDRAANCIQMLKKLNISKYNNVESKNIELVYGKKDRKRILVIGQVEDDESIIRGCRKPMTNNDLVWQAKMENPDAEIIYKPHPDVLFGMREMQSNPNDVKHIAKVISEPLSLSDALQTIDQVYTITSLSGFEALLRGIPVTTIGAPFYSGWGLTDDRQKVERRTRTLTIAEVFAAAYILYPRYMHPITREFITIEEAINTIKYMKDIDSKAYSREIENSAAIFIGIKKSFQDYLKTTLTKFHYFEEAGNEDELNLLLEKYHHVSLFVWKENLNEKYLQAANKKNILLNIVESGMIKSIGLIGADHNPISFATYLYGNSENESLVNILRNYDFNSDTELKIRAKEGIKKLVESKISGINIANHSMNLSFIKDKQKKRVLILGKKENGTVNSSNVYTNKDLIWIAKMENPDAEILFKPHPEDTFESENEDFFSYYHFDHVAKILSEPIDLGILLESIDYVYTIDSSGGFEALLRDIPVTTYGRPFYAGWGLTDDRVSMNDRNRSLSKYDLFAAAYLLFPKYVNPFTKETISFEKAIVLYSFIYQTEAKRSATNKDVFKINKEKSRYLHINSESKELLEIPESNFQIKNESVSKIGVLSKGIQAIPNLQSFFKGKLVFNPSGKLDEIDYIAGWGMKPSAKSALEFSKKYNVSYLGLEDGFLRSLGLGVNGSPALSLCVDDVGIYYDATRPSRLENILNSNGWESDALLNMAQKAIALIKKNYLSKYNHAPMINSSIFRKNGRKRILIVDQTLGDMSITLGLANQALFKQMYRQAKEDNPSADIYVKTHPDVISGKKQGNLTVKDVGEKTIFIYDDCNPLSLLEHVDMVYVVTSQMGFEALLLGKEVYCYGMPFYAGWGITKDHQMLERRRKIRTVEEVFAAAYLLYPRYINPKTKQLGNIFDVINYLAEHKPQEIKVLS